MDNAATSFPKAPGVSAAMVRYTEEVGASINRGVYGSAQEAGLEALTLRERAGRLLGRRDPTHCVVTPGDTWGLNMVLLGALGPGDHCLVSAVEHNAVMRPLHALRERGVTFDRAPCDRAGRLDLRAMEGLFRPNTRLVLLAHGSNVSGAVQDEAGAAELCRRRGVPLVLDAAQTAGHFPIDFDGLGLAALCAPGHKGLLGPSGTGLLLLSEEFAAALRPIITGGTGSASHEEVQPPYMPDKFESGTPNLPGIYGLSAALGYLLSQGDAVRRREEEMVEQFLEGLRGVEGVRLAGPWEAERRAAVFSLDFLEMDNAEAAFRLEADYGILTRCGLHCAPAAHKALGTFPQGTVRFSPGPFTTDGEIQETLAAVRALAGA